MRSRASANALRKLSSKRNPFWKNASAKNVELLSWPQPKDDHDIIFGVDRCTELIEGLAQIADGCKGPFQHGARVVDEQHRAVLGIEPAVHQIARDFHVLAEHVLVGKGREPDEIQIGGVL